MKYWSEELQQKFDTEEECIAAEEKYQEGIKKLEEESLKLKEEKRTRAKEVQEAFETFKEAEKAYYRLRNEFIKDYGYYHTTYSIIENLDRIDIDRLWNQLFNVDQGKLI